MDLRQKISKLAEELGNTENKMHYVIGITESNCKKALDRHAVLRFNKIKS